MNIRKYTILKFFIILFMLLPAICTDSLLITGQTGIADNTGTVSFYKFTNNHHNNADISAERNDYHSNILCTTDTLNTSAVFEVNSFINRTRGQERFLGISFICVLLFMLYNNNLCNFEIIFIHIEQIIKRITSYIHKSDGKKRIYI